MGKKTPGKEEAAAGTSNGQENYTCPWCYAVFEAHEAVKAHVFAVHRAEPPPEPEGMITIEVNGEKHRIRVEPEWTLHYLLHDRLGLTGTKLMCDRGACGSCTVIMNGKAVLSCMTLARECDGKRVETVEGVAAAGHPLIEEYVRHHCMQCGYCTPGFVVTAKALLDKNPFPDLEEIREALGGNLCRCGTYPQHPKAIMEAAKKLSTAGAGK
ncbi:MAG TPA: (2Fe-2S)-binding protein [Acidobacteriota bacterium]|nr:(2Fe-2S)-binding protein [Acidobacteriota bacterium]